MELFRSIRRRRSRFLCPNQDPEELWALVRLADPTRVLEVGVEDGGTYRIWDAYVPESRLVVGVDRDPTLESLPRRPGRHFVQGDSRDARVFREVSRLVGGKPLDLLFIDGGHSYETVKSDYETYSPLVGPGGIVALHDIYAFGVKDLWPEVSEGKPSVELSSCRPNFGIGVIWK